MATKAKADTHTATHTAIKKTPTHTKRKGGWVGERERRRRSRSLPPQWRQHEKWVPCLSLKLSANYRVTYACGLIVKYMYIVRTNGTCIHMYVYICVCLCFPLNSNSRARLQLPLSLSLSFVCLRVCNTLALECCKGNTQSEIPYYSIYSI